MCIRDRVEMEPKQKILIVDDSEINRAMLKEILGEGYEYLEAENGPVSYTHLDVYKRQDQVGGTAAL